MNSWGLVIDVGGTNIRLSLVDQKDGLIEGMERYLCSEYETLQEVIDLFLRAHKTTVEHVCVAVAGPADEDLIELTNNHWRFSVSQLQADLKLETLCVINDYHAIAMSVPYLQNDQKVKIGDGKPKESEPIGICGPGTGLGVALLTYQNDRWTYCGGEGGHVDFAPQTELEDYLLRSFRKRISHVSVERFISGPGLVNIYQGIMGYYQESSQTLSPSEITVKAIEGSDLRCREALNLFCQLLGAFCGNLALTAGTFGGVFVAGGIAPKMIDFIKASGFRDRFEAKGRFSSDMKKIPTYVITHPEPGLMGAAMYLQRIVPQKT